MKSPYISPLNHHEIHQFPNRRLTRLSSPDQTAKHSPEVRRQRHGIGGVVCKLLAHGKNMETWSSKHPKRKGIDMVVNMFVRLHWLWMLFRFIKSR